MRRLTKSQIERLPEWLPLRDVNRKIMFNPKKAYFRFLPTLKDGVSTERII